MEEEGREGVQWAYGWFTVESPLSLVDVAALLSRFFSPGSSNHLTNAYACIALS